jgi:hypothetical protein
MRCQQVVRAEDGYLSYTPWLPLRPSANDSWSYLVGQLSARAITYPRDRLAAIAGLAKYRGKASAKMGRPIIYIAGHSLDVCFPSSLCWEIAEHTQSYSELIAHRRDEDRYQVPSWSWASRYCRVGFKCTLPSSSLVTVIGFDLSPAGGYAAVGVKHGSFLTLRGKSFTSPLSSRRRLQRVHPSYCRCGTVRICSQSRAIL